MRKRINLIGWALVLMAASAVAQTAPTITWPTPAAITYGTALSATQLNATANVAGTFVYSPGSGIYPEAGLNVLSATFTPSVSGYTTVTVTVQLAVTSSTSGTGAVGSIPMFVGASSLANSGLTQSNEYIDASYSLIVGGLPAYLSNEHAGVDQPSIIVNGLAAGWSPNFDGNSIAIYDFRNGSNNYNAGPGYFPAPALYLGKSRSGTIGTPGGIAQNGDTMGAVSFIGDNGANFDNLGASIAGQVDAAPSSTSVPGRLVFATSAVGSAYPAERMRITSGGYVGIGTTAPAATLEVNGNAQMDGNVALTSSTATVTFGDGTKQTTAWTGALCGGDYAEAVNVTGARAAYEPGDVMVVDPASPGKFLKSAEPYSTLVAGIYSTKPGAVGRRQMTAKSPDEVPMAMIGIVPTKVSAENGAVKPGDLLVTSSKLGYAMKGTDRERINGAIVGKALGSVERGTGVIEVLVTLQ